MPLAKEGSVMGTAILCLTLLLLITTVILAIVFKQKGLLGEVKWFEFFTKDSWQFSWDFVAVFILGGIISLTVGADSLAESQFIMAAIWLASFVLPSKKPED